jgi:hypothetical protein
MRAKRKCNLRRKGKAAMLDFGNTRNRANFHMLVRTVILKAAYVAATACGANVPRRLQIAIVGSRRDGTYVDIADVTDVLFRDDGLVARRIDVSVGNIRGDFADVRIVVAEPEACRFDESYNSPKGYGPFRVVHWLASDRMTGT